MEVNKYNEIQMKVINEAKAEIDDYIKTYPILKSVFDNKEVSDILKKIVHLASGTAFDKGYAYCMRELIEKMDIESYFECGESELKNRLV